MLIIQHTQIEIEYDFELDKNIGFNSNQNIDSLKNFPIIHIHTVARFDIPISLHMHDNDDDDDLMAEAHSFHPRNTHR